VQIQFSLPGMPDVLGYEFPCELMRYSGSVSPGTYTAQLRALAGARVVAESLDSAPFDVTDQGLADLGVVTISPCGASCP